MRTRPFGKAGVETSVIGQGTWNIARAGRSQAVAALRRGLDLGMTHIDTAEYYGEAENITGEAIAGRRDEVFLVSKVMPGNATRNGTVKACEASLAKLKTDHLDCYLLHWRGSVPLADTIAGFDRLWIRARSDRSASAISMSAISRRRGSFPMRGSCATRSSIISRSARSNTASSPGAKRMASRSWPIARWAAATSRGRRPPAGASLPGSGPATRRRRARSRSLSSPATPRSWPSRKRRGSPTSKAMPALGTLCSHLRRLMPSMLRSRMGVPVPYPWAEKLFGGERTNQEYRRTCRFCNPRRVVTLP